MSYTLYELYDGLTMLISPTLETAFDQVERWNAQRSLRKRINRRSGLEQQTKLLEQRS